MGLLHWFGGGILAGTIGVWAGAVVLSLAYLTTRRRRNLATLACGIGLAVGLGRSQQYNLALQARRWTGTLTNTTGLVCAPADRRDGYVFLTICFDSPHTTVRAKVGPYTTYEVGDFVSVSGSVTKPTSQDSSFDYAQYLERFLVFGTMKKPTVTPSDANRPPPTPLKLWRELTITRHTIENQINHLLPEPEASFLAGLLLGSKRLIPPDILTDLQRTGTTHIIAVSGANVVIVASFILIAARYITFNTRAAWWLSLLVIWGFVVLTGLSAPAVRGATVATFSLWTKHQHRYLPVATALVIPAAASVVINPTIIHDIGWQLSYAAFGGIIIVAPWLQKMLARRSLAPPGVVTETVAATLATAPVSWWGFGTLSLSGLLINPLVLWLVPLATGVGVVSVTVVALVPLLALPFRIVTTLILRSMLTIIHLGSFIPLTWGGT